MPKSAPVQNIGAASTGDWAPRTKRWKRAEQIVVDHLKTRGWRTVEHNVRLCSVQVDIVARSSSGLLTLFEVKMQSRHRLARVSVSQLERLGRVAEWLAVVEPVELQLALVEDGKVRLLPVDALTDF